MKDEALPFGVGGGLVAIKTLLSRDPCAHANTAIEMIDAILKEHPAAQRQWVGFDDDEFDYIFARANPHCNELAFARAIEAKVFEKNGATGVTVPDAIHHTDLSESLEYIQGWNDCRQAMMEMMK
jgi:hypothetical protein